MTTGALREGAPQKKNYQKFGLGSPPGGVRTSNGNSLRPKLQSNSRHGKNLIIISSYHHISEPKSASQFWPKSLGKNRNRFFYPSTKNHRELIFWTSGVIFRDEFHGNAQKFTAPPNRHFTCFETTFETLQNLQTAGKSRG